MELVKKDKRFAGIFRDPLLKKMPTVERKTKIDKRFQAMFEDENFKLKYSMDKRGRPWKHTTSEDLKKFYAVSSSSDHSDSEEEGDSDADEVSENADSTRQIEEKVKKGKVKKQHDEQNLVNDAVSDDDDADNTAPDLALDEEGEKANCLKAGGDDCLKASDDDDDAGGGGEDEEEEEEEEKEKEYGSESESSSDTEEEEEIGDDDDEEEFDHKWEELDADAPSASEATKRLAVCNMDWDRIRAEDILAVFNSFKPADGIIHSIKIYPSEFGMKRMEEEKLRGPTELVNHSDETSSEKLENSKYHREKLRQYQINRLKYYYAVVECDSSETANSLYEQLNGMEYESSAICMDVRFIPDDMTFEQEPKSVATSAPDPTEYRPRLFVNSALQQVKVDLTWDETDPARRETLQKAFREPESIEKDLKDYLASSSSSSSESDLEDESEVREEDSADKEDGDGKFKSRKQKMEERIATYKSLLQSLEEKEKENENKYEMEITWEPGLKEKTEEIVKEKMQNKKLTPFEEKLQKKKEERKQKRRERKAHLMKNADDISEDNESDIDVSDTEDHERRSHTDYRKISTKHVNKASDGNMAKELSLICGDDADEEQDDVRDGRRKKKKNAKTDKMGGFEVDINDSRFSAVYSSHLFNIDPSDPHFKDTKGMHAIIQAKQRKRQNESNSPSGGCPKSPKSFISEDTSSLLESIKRKTKRQKMCTQ